MPQWVLRNFRSDDTANAKKGKQRVWCHTVYLDETENIIKEQPLPITSVGLAKSCFSLIDKTTNKLFDIEQELSNYERTTSETFNKFIHHHDFSSLLHQQGNENSIETVLNFMIIQMILNLHNPQHKYHNKEEFFSSFTKEMQENFGKIHSTINEMPKTIADLYGKDFAEKLVRAVNSPSEIEQTCKVLFILFLLAEAKGLPTPINPLTFFKNHLFGNVYIEGIFHTGYPFNSTEPRPVFAIGPNVFAKSAAEGPLIYLPIAHNFAFGFSVGKRKAFNSRLKIYSANPENLSVSKNNKIEIFKVSHDFIDNVVMHVLMGAIGYSNTIYTPHELADVEKYLALQRENEDFFYQPEKPTLISQ
ncbi:hypothetical protein SRM1_03144 [Pseudomonas fluorescens]|nr:hypothetical protein SRM1_03144 [Pseudomonas fluorescens]